MNETYVTLQGWLGATPTLRPAGDSMVATFRVASTPRRYSRRTDEWFNADTQWYTVTAWRGLGENCARSLQKGDAVFVHGKLSSRVWRNAEGVDVTSIEVEAAFVGHDLNRGTSRFTKPLRPELVGAPVEVAPAPAYDAPIAATAPRPEGVGAIEAA